MDTPGRHTEIEMEDIDNLSQEADPLCKKAWRINSLDKKYTTSIHKCLKLQKLLQDYNLYEDLWDILSSQHVDLEMIKNDLKPQELNTFYKAFGLNSNQSLKFH